MILFLLHRDPDGAVIVGVGLLAVDAVVPFHCGVAAKLVVGVAGEPVAEDGGVDALKSLRVRAYAVEDCPVVARELVEDHALGDVAAGVLSGDEIAEFVAAKVVDADAVLTDAVVYDGLFEGVGRLVAGVYVSGIFAADLVPEFRDLRVGSLHVKFFLKADNLEREHWCDLVIHKITSFYGYVDRQRDENVDGGAAPDLRRRISVKTRERFGEALGRLVTVSEGDVDYPVIRFLQVQRRLIKPAVSDVLTDPVARHQRKAFLKDEGRQIHLVGDILRADVVPEVILHVIDRFADACKPLHRPCLLFVMSSAYRICRAQACLFLSFSVRAGAAPLPYFSFSRAKRGAFGRGHKQRTQGGAPRGLKQLPRVNK